MSDWAIPAVLDVVTGAVPDRDMIVWKSVRRTYAEVQDRTRRLAGHFRAAGLGLQRERADLERWECGQHHVAVVLSNCPEYVETLIAAFRARIVPFNVNHHYNAIEVAALLEQIGTDAVVYHRRLGPLLAEAGVGDRVLVDVDDGSGVEPLPGSVSYEVALSNASVDELPVPSPDDLYFVCTGGTTGRPKAVMWREGDAFVGAMGGRDGVTADEITAAVAGPPRVWFPAPPLMHAAAQWTVFSCMHNGGTVVLHDDSGPFDPPTILHTIEREGVQLMSIVGDAYARPLVEEANANPYDLSSLQVLATGGAMTSPELKHAFLELLPNVMVLDGYGASETGGMAFGHSQKNAETREFRGAVGAALLSEDRRHLLEPGTDEIGWLVRMGRVPLGYLNDPDATARTFPVVDGRRYAVPGDRATLAPDGAIQLLGRDSMVINSGGEKIFVEEVEEALRRHPDVFDAVVVGRPSERFGQEVVGIVQLREECSVAGVELREFVAADISRFKAPRAILNSERIKRHPSGKADYRWAREAAVDAVDVTKRGERDDGP